MAKIIKKKTYSEPELGGLPKGFKPSDLGLKNAPKTMSPDKKMMKKRKMLNTAAKHMGF